MQAAETVVVMGKPPRPASRRYLEPRRYGRRSADGVSGDNGQESTGRGGFVPIRSQR